MSPRFSRLLAGSVLGSTARDVTAPLLLMHLHISHLLNSLNSSLPGTSVPHLILPKRKKTSLLNIFFRMAPCQSWGAWKHRRKSLMQCLSCRRFKDLFCSFSPSPTNLLPVSLPVEVRGGCKKFQLRRQRLSHLAAVQNSIACFQKPVCLPAGRVCKGHATLRPCLGERERERERERWGKATHHGSALPTLPYLAEQLFTV